MPDGLVIRPARAADADAIDGVVRAAFAGTAFGHQGEAELVRMLELSDACERSVGQPVPTMYFTRRVLKASADRPNARLTERIAA